ncbi:MAG TPA: two-component system sensor histidine kinase CreC [Steroidobacteraceae bacterium]|nr:two-component system sensor histidine kinase CreC [Steroidobacteraceae bacterium]
MNRRNRIFAGILLAYLAGVGLLMWRLVGDIAPRYRESAEDSMVETAQLLATLLEPTATPTGPYVDAFARVFSALRARQFDAEIYGVKKQRVDLRATVVDGQGHVLFDSLGRSLGADFSRWRDVRLALEGKYGARTSRDTDSDSSSEVMYVSVPIFYQDRIVGAVTVGKPVTSLGQYMQSAQHKTLVAGVTAGFAALVLMLILSLWLVIPSGLVADYLRRVRMQRSWDLSGLWRHLMEMTATAYKDVRDALEGRSFAADYAQTLTHELKSPLSAIRGAADLLQEPMDDADRRRFLGNIERETQRIHELVDRMMQLAALESRRLLDAPQTVDMPTLLEELATSAAASGAGRGIQVKLDVSGPAEVLGDALLLKQAVGNLLANALDFSPSDSSIELSLETSAKAVTISVKDQGPGIPHFAGDKVFEKFFSLTRPGSSRKSTGLGLTFVREIAHLHYGRAAIRNREEGGAIATLTLPRVRTTS